MNINEVIEKEKKEMPRFAEGFFYDDALFSDCEACYFEDLAVNEYTEYLYQKYGKNAEQLKNLLKPYFIEELKKHF